ncbi:MAG: DNA gyrase/topoisomerase IV subunit A, partial [Saprospiraceae bacterium]|nr:DNA gyrase/topoisomerase IV subunit A [Saprospiraceae bacterium]
TTTWQLSYDGRKKEPVTLPVKFPLLLAQGVEGIAVGLSTKILPHNFIELIKASIKILQGKKVKIYPDFPTGGSIDVSDYNSGARGGRVKVRAKIEVVDKSTLAVRDLPFGVTTGSLIESIVKANDKGKIKVKKVVDNTAQFVEVHIELAPGVSPDVTVDALYAFTDCEVSISPNACVIVEDRPVFTTVEDILEISTNNTRELLRRELEIKKHELQEKWHFASLEKIFIEKRIYHEIEECESWEEVMATIYRELARYVSTPSDPPKPGDARLPMHRNIDDDDITRLTEIRIKRISKYNAFKADELIAQIEADLLQVQHDLDHLTEYAIAYFERLLDKYGKGRERRTLITEFDAIQATEVVANNAKLYVNRVEGFIGSGLKKDEFVCDCSDIDDIIVFRRDGKFQVSRISDKVFVGKDIIHVAVWKKNDERTTYNMAYSDGKTGRSFVKRFNVTAITRDREYDLTQGNPNSKLLYFSANPNGEAEIVVVQLSAGATAKIKIFDYNFAELEIKGRSSQGNILTKYPVKKLILKEAGKSTLGAQHVWIDEVSGKLNTDNRGRLLGDFDTGDQLFLLYKDGTYEVADVDMSRRFDPDELLHLGKFDPEMVVNAVHFDGNKGWTMVKRFRVETTSTGQRFSYLSEHKDSKLLFASIKKEPRIEYSIKIKGKKIQGEVNLADFIDVKGWKAVGNKLSDQKLSSVKELEDPTMFQTPDSNAAEVPLPEKFHAGDSLEFDMGKNGQGSLF